MSLFIIPASLTNVDTENLADNAVTYAKLGTEIQPISWKELARGSFTNTADITSLDPHDEYLIRCYECISTGANGVLIRVNGITSTSYACLVSNSTPTFSIASVSYFNAISTLTTSWGFFDMIIGGKSPAVTNGQISMYVNGGKYGDTGANLLGHSGYMTLGNNIQVDEINITRAGGANTVTGKYIIYGRSK